MPIDRCREDIHKHMFIKNKFLNNNCYELYYACNLISCLYVLLSDDLTINATKSRVSIEIHLYIHINNITHFMETISYSGIIFYLNRVYKPINIFLLFVILMGKLYFILVPMYNIRKIR